MKTLLNKTLQWKSIRESVLERVVPSLTFDSYKGQMGKIGVLGGSEDYTGAPFYASIAALKFGCDLAFVFCAKQALIPIKSYSPELMVTSFYDANDPLFEKKSNSLDESDRSRIQQYASKIIDEYFPRITSLVVGPGLGRNEIVLQIVSLIIKGAKSRSLPLVIDADGLFLISRDPTLIFGYPNCLLTPNHAEFDRLISSVEDRVLASLSHPHSIPSSPSPSLASSLPSTINSVLGSDDQNGDAILRGLRDPQIEVRLVSLSRALGGVGVLRKGRHDMLCSSSIHSDNNNMLTNMMVKETVWVVEALGSPRRPGGQGDVLAGCLGVAMQWASALSLSQSSNPPPSPLRSYPTTTSLPLDSIPVPGEQKECAGLEGGIRECETFSIFDSNPSPSPSPSVVADFDVEVVHVQYSNLEEEEEEKEKVKSSEKFIESSGSPSLASLSLNMDLDLGTLPLPVLAGLVACPVLRRAAAHSFSLKGRSLTTPDMIDAIGGALASL